MDLRIDNVDEIPRHIPELARQRTENVEWAGCCSKSDSAFVKYVAQLGISFTVLGFCITMVILNKGKECEVYFSLISGIVGLYSPQPQLKHRQ